MVKVRGLRDRIPPRVKDWVARRMRNWRTESVGRRSFNLVFLSGHHRHTHEMAIHCHEVGIHLSLPPEETQGLLRHYVYKELIPIFGLEAYGVHYYESYGDLKRAVDKGRVHAFMVSLPEHLDLVREHFGSVSVAADHMVNRYDDYRARGLQHFLSPSRRALAFGFAYRPGSTLPRRADEGRPQMAAQFRR